MSVPVWRLTRSRTARRLYDGLDRVGVTVTRLREYRATLDTVPDRDPPAGVSLVVGRVGDPARHDETGLAAGDVVVTARSDGTTVGRVYVALARPVYVDALDAEVRVDGAYVFGLWVAPAHRNRGVATALVAAACRSARDVVDRAVALVAPDNRPSQRVFEACGFVPGRTHAYDRLFGWTRRDPRPTGDD